MAMTREEAAVINAAIKYVEVGRSIGYIGYSASAMQWQSFKDAVSVLIHSCPRCNTERHTCPGCGAPVQHTEVACSGCVDDAAEFPTDAPPWKPEVPALICQCSRTEKVYCAASDCHGGADVADWVSTTFRYVLTNDRVRIGTEEATVVQGSVGQWYVDNTDTWRPKSWKHIETRFTFDPDHGLAPMTNFPPNGSVDILMDQERLAFHRLSLDFPGTSIL